DPTPPVGAAPVAPTEGALAFVRDIVEAAAQRWNRHVVGYDLDQQLRLLRTFSQRYSSGGPDSLWSTLSPRRIALLALALGLLVVGYRLLRRERAATRDPNAPGGAGAAQLAIVALYRQLDAALTARGIARPAGT